MKIISKYKNAQLVFVDGETPAKIKRILFEEGRFHYVLRETGEVFPEERISLLKN